MGKLCERPGCSDVASMSFGFDKSRLLVWIRVRQPMDDPMQAGALCRRHADSMVVPRGWTLDDQRQLTPQLFRDGASASADEAAATAPTKARRRRSSSRPAQSVDPPEQPAPDEPMRTVADVADVAGPVSDPDSTAPLPWWPTFDQADDLDGVLAADSPLLARAFRGADRSR